MFLSSLSLPPLLLPDAVAYAALLRNELLGAGIETVPDPHTDDRRHAVLSQDSHSLFRVRVTTEKRLFSSRIEDAAVKQSLTLTLVLCSTPSTLRECLSIAITKSHHTPFLHLVTRGMNRLTQNRNGARASLSGNVFFFSMFFSAVTSCSAPLANQPVRSQRSPSKCWTLRSCRMTSTSTW